MSELLRQLQSRLPSGAINGDFVDERSIADLLMESAGQPTEPTAMVQLRRMAEGKSPGPMVNEMQLDR